MITLFLNKILSQLYHTSSWAKIKSNLKEGNYPILIEGPKGSFISIVISAIFNELKTPSLIITPTEQEAENLYQDVSSWIPGKTALFPWGGTLPYGDNPPLASRYRERSGTLLRILAGEKILIFSSLRALLTPLPSAEEFKRNTVELKKGDTPNLSVLEKKLQEMGYLRVPKVSVTGEFSVRGEVIDISPENSANAYRILLDYDKITDIRAFDPLTQATKYSKSELSVPPLYEIIINENSLDNLKKNLESCSISPQMIDAVYEGFLRNTSFNIQNYLPMLLKDIHSNKHSIIEYFPSEAAHFIIDDMRITANYRMILKEYNKLHKSTLKEGKEYPAPDYLFNTYPNIRVSIKKPVLFPGLKEAAEHGKDTRQSIKLACDHSHSFFGNITYLKEEIGNLLNNGYEIFIFAVYEQQARRISFLLKDFDITVMPFSITAGFILPGLKIMVIQENEIFGRKKRIPRSIGKARSEFIDSFTELNPGDYIVHINYGIGIFKGIKRMTVLGNERDYIELEYDREEIIFIPVEQVNLIQRYIIQNENKPRLDRIGGKSWINRKERVKKSVEELARMLVKLYSERNRTSGFAFPEDSDWQNEFEAGFPYQETGDQLKCIEDVKRDMEKPIPMDRLICGDVGYGKTEIALRAAFKAVMGGKQAALLAPTTILVEQHYETFTDRFRQFPVRIGMLSRFRSRKEQSKTIEGLKKGEIDIVIGTHRLVQGDVKFKNIGLLIIDEEQRFGVKHKEIIKELKTNVDCLTLTATPIPRTLHMSLMKIRDMSILNTPPQNRLPIETIVSEFDESIVKNAIKREIKRNGQVFYLHNRIKTIINVYHFLSRLCPELSIDISHGQMAEDELEEVMHRFIRGDSHILLATSIIENGLDIPNVNTIIIDRADIFGIAQLYQLRGRVGRSDQPSYAYLFYPKGKVLSELAMKRLRIISDFTELGSGFKIALKDLEIRGAGNLLGREQHGDILAVGLDMYIKLLEEAVNGLETGHAEKPPDLYLELEYTGFIPDRYIEEPVEKMEVYKKIASISSYEEFDAIYREIRDRFGTVPDEVDSLFSISEIRIVCRKLYISSLVEKRGIVRIEFSRLSIISVDKVMRVIKESGGSVFFNEKAPNCLFLKTGSIDVKDKTAFIKDKLSMLTEL